MLSIRITFTIDDVGLSLDIEGTRAFRVLVGVALTLDPEGNLRVLGRVD